MNTIYHMPDTLSLSLHVWVCMAGPNTGFECVRSWEHHKPQKVLQTDRSFVFCFMFNLDKYALL